MSTPDYRSDPEHLVSIGPYGGGCTCGKVFRCNPRFGAVDGLKSNNLARANARRHGDAKAKAYRLANPLPEEVSGA